MSGQDQQQVVAPVFQDQPQPSPATPDDSDRHQRDAKSQHDAPSQDIHGVGSHVHGKYYGECTPERVGQKRLNESGTVSRWFDLVIGTGQRSSCYVWVSRQQAGSEDVYLKLSHSPVDERFVIVDLISSSVCRTIDGSVI